MYGQGRSAEVQVSTEEGTTGQLGQEQSKKSIPTWHKSLTSATIDDIRKSVEPVCKTLEYQDPPRRKSRSGSRGGSRTPTGSSLTPGRSPPTQPPSALSPRTQSPLPLILSGSVPARSPGSSHSSLGESPPAKRMRTSTGSDANALDTSERWRQQTVKTARGEWIDFLNDGRCEMRTVLYKEFMFLRELIEQNFEKQAAAGTDGIAAAALCGYRFVFDDRNIDKELTIPADARGTIWDIAPADAVDMFQARDIYNRTATGKYENVQKVFELRNKFTCLSVQCHYKREVRRDPGEAITPASTGPSSRTVYYDNSESLSMHVIAINMLVEIFQVQDAAAFLSMSSQSIRTVHVMAIALRGLLRQSLGLSLASVESAALGNAVHRDIKIDEDLVTTRMEPPKQGKQKVTVAKNIAGKLTMTLAEYLASRSAGDQASISGEAAFVEPTRPASRTGTIARDAIRNWLA